MEAVVDGTIYQIQAQGGISRLYSEILPRMCEMEGSLAISLFTSGRPRQALPTHPRIRRLNLLPVDSVLRPRRVWGALLPRVRAFFQRIALGDARGRIWHSTYYTMLEGWCGPAVVTVVDMIHELFPHLFDSRSDAHFREQKRRCVLAADAVVCISETTRIDAQQFYGVDAARTYVVPLASSAVFRPLAGSLLTPLTRRPFLLYVGGRAHYKNFLLLLQAYLRWARRGEVDLVVVGPPWSKQEAGRLARLGIAGRVHLETGVDDHTLCRLYNQAHAFVYPSLYEGFGLPLLEAMACGCPVVASRIPAALEVAGECPIYFEPTKVESLLAALDVTLSEGRDSGRVQRGLQRTRRFSWDRTARQVLEVYRALSDAG